MPRSSEAFSSSTMLPILPPYICLATARIVDVLPVPGGPYNRRWGRRFSLTRRLTAGSSDRRSGLWLHKASESAALMLLTGIDDLFVGSNFIKRLRSELFHPRCILLSCCFLPVSTLCHDCTPAIKTARLPCFATSRSPRFREAGCGSYVDQFVRK